jgi:biotin carboxyl carrier protein
MGGPLGEDAAMKYVTIVNGQQFEIEIGKDGELSINGERRQVDFLNLGPSLYSLISNHLSLQVVVDGESGHYEVLMKGHLYEIQVLDERALMMAQRRGGLGASSGDLHSPMPGLIVAVQVEVGQGVMQGETLVILESMKMQNELKAPVDGVVESIKCEAGQTVDKGTLLVTVKTAESDDE